MGRFEYSKEFSELERHWLDPATKTIFSFARGGMAGAIHNANRYEVSNNLPVLIYSENQDFDPGKNQYHCVVREQHGDAMSTVRDEWADTAPCDAGELFRQYVYPRRMTLPGTTVRVIG
jgi:hypothetical protein